LPYGQKDAQHQLGGKIPERFKMETNIDPNAIVEDLLEQIKQLTAANTVLRVNLNTAQRVIVELQEQAALAEEETPKESGKTTKS
jgi:hypothetical protein